MTNEAEELTLESALAEADRCVSESNIIADLKRIDALLKEAAEDGSDEE